MLLPNGVYKMSLWATLGAVLTRAALQTVLGILSHIVSMIVYIKVPYYNARVSHTSVPGSNFFVIFRQL